jgi:DNA-binding protein Fis
MNTFYTASEEVKQIVKGLNLTKTLFVSSVIVGEPHTGKKTLVRHLFPQTPMISATDTQAVETALEECDEIIITDFERYPNPSALDFDGKRIVATANYTGNPQLIDTLFAFIYTMPPLRERPDDAAYLKEKFVQEAIRTLMLDEKKAETVPVTADLSFNSRSLKRSVYLALMSSLMDEQAIETAIYRYMLEHLEGNNGYREHIGLFERPLIRAGLEKFGSQLKLSEVLGINRNTLRKKIHEHGID